MSMACPYRTSEISKAVGVHANTVRLYEEWGFLPPIPRSASGYRQFSEMHLEQMRLARIAYREPYGGRRIRRSARALVRLAATGELEGALILGEKHLARVHSELDQTRAAADYLERWAAGEGGQRQQGTFLQRGKVANLLDVTAEKVFSCFAFGTQ